MGDCIYLVNPPLFCKPYYALLFPHNIDADGVSNDGRLLWIWFPIALVPPPSVEVAKVCNQLGSNFL